MSESITPGQIGEACEYKMGLPGVQLTLLPNGSVMVVGLRGTDPHKVEQIIAMAGAQQLGRGGAAQ